MALPAARKLARFGIKVNTIAPGIFLTPHLAELPEEVRRGLSAVIRRPARLSDPTEFADAVVFALSHVYLNAEVIQLDGALRQAPK